MQFERSTALAAAICLLAAPGFAGGPVIGKTEPEVLAPVPVVLDYAKPRFAGGYVGGSLGYAFNGDDVVGVIPPTGPVTNHGDLEMSGAIADIHAGYRWLPGPFVWGVELGLEGGDVKDDANDGIYDSETKMKYAVSLRGTFGYSYSDETIIYGFAGVSHGKFDYTVAGPLGTIDAEVSRTGYIVGAGVEHALNDRWSLRGEYQFSDYGKERLESAGFDTHATPKFHSVRLGVNYSF